MYEVKNMKCLEMFVIYNCLHKTKGGMLGPQTFRVAGVLHFTFTHFSRGWGFCILPTHTSWAAGVFTFYLHTLFGAILQQY